MNSSFRVPLYCHFLQEAFRDLTLEIIIHGDCRLIWPSPRPMAGTTDVFSICTAPAPLWNVC